MAIYVLGMDGLDKQVIEENIEKFPNFAKLDIYGLESVYPPITVPAWACSFSGLDPDKLEVFDFQMIDFEDYSFHPVKDEEFNHEGFWNYFKGETAIAGIPGSGTPKLNGVSVGNVFHFSNVESSSERFMQKLENELGGVEGKSMWESDSEEGKRKIAYENFEKRKQIFDILFEEDADVYYTVFRLSDAMMHHTVHEKHLVEAYEKLDEYLGRVIEKNINFEEDNLLVVSDHGAVKAEKRLFLNRLLEDKGFLKRKEDEQNSRIDDLMLRAGDIAQRLGFRDLVSSINNIFSHRFNKNIAPRKSETMGKINFEKTEAFSFMTGVSAYGGVWINDERFSNSQVEDKEAKKRDLKEVLEQKEEIRNVYYSEELYDKEVEKFPDLVVECFEDTKMNFGFHPDVVANVKTYMHRKEGVLMAKGSDIVDNDVEAELIDVAPTLLHLEGEKVPSHMDGKVLDIAEGEPVFSLKKDEDELSGIDF